MAALWLVALAMSGTACTGNSTAAVTGIATTSALTTMPTAAGTSEPEATNAASAPIPAADADAIREAIQLLNSTAAGTVADQRSALAALVDPALAAALDQCPTATTTLRFEPSYRDLRRSQDWRSPSGTLSGSIYALPSLVRIYTGSRITGTDLTTLHLGVQAGEAYLTPLCVG